MRTTHGVFYTLLTLLIVSAVVNAALIFGGLWWVHKSKNVAYSNGYSDGIKKGVYTGFKVGLETGRACITDGVAGQCEGSTDFLIEKP